MVSENSHRQKSVTLPIMIVMVLAAGIFAPVVIKLSGFAYDYIVHSNIAKQMLMDKRLLTPHFFLQTAIIVFHLLMPIAYTTACAMVVLLAIATTAGIIFHRMVTAINHDMAAAIVTISLLFAAPLTFLWKIDHHLYLGYVGINVVHNPTMFLLKPFALILFLYATKPKESFEQSRWISLVLCSMASLACAFSKPSYTIVIVAALPILFAVFPEFRKKVSLLLVVAGIIIPSLLALGYQYWFTYSSEQLPGIYQGKSSIIIAPLKVMSFYSSWLLPKLILSILFPLTVAWCNIRRVLHSPSLLLAWTSFLIGTTYTYLLAESGPRMFQGNFTWSSQITLFILFIVSMEFLWQNRSSSDTSYSKKFIACMVIFVLHVANGIIFYGVEYIANERFW